MLAGNVRCWGEGVYGQLGTGTQVNSMIPVDVVDLPPGMRSVAAGLFHTCAVTGVGGVMCWGDNGYKQLGADSVPPGANLRPRSVASLETGISAISAGSFHTCVATDVGGMKCWGSNGYGQLGIGNAQSTGLPSDVLGLSATVASMTTGTTNSCALLGTGGMKCWGDNGYGQLGDGTISTERRAPVDVLGLGTTITAAGSKGAHVCALTGAGGAKCWGWNLFGQLGNGGTATSSVPVDVVGEL